MAEVSQTPNRDDHHKARTVSGRTAHQTRYFRIARFSGDTTVKVLFILIYLFMPALIVHLYSNKHKIQKYLFSFSETVFPHFAQTNVPIFKLQHFWP